jgi:hypothetical protein
MPFDSALQKHTDRELIIAAQEKARREAMGDDYDLDEILAEQPFSWNRVVLILLVNAIFVAIFIYLLWLRKNKQ